MISITFAAEDVSVVKQLFTNAAPDLTEIRAFLIQGLAQNTNMQDAIQQVKEQIMGLKEQLDQIEHLEEDEAQAVKDAGVRVDQGFQELKDALAAAGASSPQLDAVIAKMQTNVSNLALIAAAAGTPEPTPELPPDGEPVTI